MDFRGSVNDISVLLNKDGNIKQVKDEMKKILDPYGLIGTTERKDQTSYSMFHTDELSLRSMAAVFPMLFFIASAVIIYITMTRMIENQRTQMGILKGLGYGNWEITLHYLTLSDPCWDTGKHPWLSDRYLFCRRGASCNIQYFIQPSDSRFLRESETYRTRVVACAVLLCCGGLQCLPEGASPCACGVYEAEAAHDGKKDAH